MNSQGETREEEITTRSMAICNGRYFGSGMMVAPMAALDDGVFEVVDLGKAPKARFAFVSSTRIYTGEHIGHPDVRLLNEGVVPADVREQFRPKLVADVQAVQRAAIVLIDALP